MYGHYLNNSPLPLFLCRLHLENYGNVCNLSTGHMFRLFILFHLIIFTVFSPHRLNANTNPKVIVGIDILLHNAKYSRLLKGKRIGLITNHTAINSSMQTTIDLLKANADAGGYTLTALFAPEHGLKGAAHASEMIVDEQDPDGIPVYSLHGKTKRPTEAMLKHVDVLIYDIQDIGSRSYTYITTLFYVMEEAAKRKIPVLVTDRPNPINGLIVDGPMLEDKWRSTVGYINVPYCHGMTVGELALFFNAKYEVGCDLHVIPMDGWKRQMSFRDTGLAWIPTSPHIPEASTTYYYPTTGIIGELQIVNIGVGYTLPFKVVGAPWIDADLFAKHLNAQKFPGVYFQPFYYKPFYGKFAREVCQGVQIIITDLSLYQPIQTQYLLIGILKSLYPVKFKESLEQSKNRKEMFCKVTGTEEVYRILSEKKYIVWYLKALHQKERQDFLVQREKYLIPSYK